MQRCCQSADRADAAAAIRASKLSTWQPAATAWRPPLPLPARRQAAAAHAGGAGAAGGAVRRQPGGGGAGGPAGGRLRHGGVWGWGTCWWGATPRGGVGYPPPPLHAGVKPGEGGGRLVWQRENREGTGEHVLSSCCQRQQPVSCRAVASASQQPAAAGARLQAPRRPRCAPRRAPCCWTCAQMQVTAACPGLARGGGAGKAISQASASVVVSSSRRQQSGYRCLLLYAAWQPPLQCTQPGSHLFNVRSVAATSSMRCHNNLLRCCLAAICSGACGCVRVRGLRAEQRVGPLRRRRLPGAAGHGTGERGGGALHASAAARAQLPSSRAAWLAGRLPACEAQQPRPASCWRQRLPTLAGACWSQASPLNATQEGPAWEGILKPVMHRKPIPKL